jgi:hypothetical protein
MPDAFEVTITKITGPDRQEIARLTLHGTAHGWEDGVSGDFNYIFAENTHPVVTRPLLARGTVWKYPLRQSVWRLVQAAVDQAVRSKLTQ